MCRLADRGPRGTRRPAESPSIRPHRPDKAEEESGPHAPRWRPSCARNSRIVGRPGPLLKRGNSFQLDQLPLLVWNKKLGQIIQTLPHIFVEYDAKIYVLITIANAGYHLAIVGYANALGNISHCKPQSSEVLVIKLDFHLPFP